MNILRKTFVVGGISLLVLMLLIAALAVGLMNGLAHLVAEWGGPAVIHIDGESFTLGSLSFDHALMVAGGVLLAILIVLVVVPLTLGAVALALGVALIAALGAPVVALALVMLVLASPVLLVLALVWLVRRVLRETVPASAPRAADATTMNA